MTNKHEKRTRRARHRRSWWTRGRKRAAAVGAVLAVGSIAWAAFTVIGGLSGTITRASVGIEATAVNQLETGTGCVSDGGVTVVDGDVELNFVNGLPGEYCRFETTWENTGSRSVRLQDTVAPDGATVTFPAAACGTTIDPAQTVVIESTVTLEEGTDPVVFDPEINGLSFTPTQDFDSGLCPA